MSHRNNDDYDDQNEGRLSGEGSEDGQSPVMNGAEHLDQAEDNDNAYATVAAVASDPKKEKEEKKRLEKERKEQEKREKEEAKRQKKEEQKQKKEEQKQQKEESGDSAAPSRRAEREAKKKLKVPSIFSQKKPGVRPKHGQKCRVLLLDGTDLEVNLDRYAYGQHLFETVCEYVDLLERDYFSLTYQDRHGIKFWLIHDRRIIKQLEEGIEWIFEFHVKFYSPEPGMLQEDITRYQLCLQLRNDILSGQLPCSFVTYALLGSYTVQSELGNYDYEEMGSGIDYIRDIDFSPNQTDDLLEKIAELHRTHYGQSPAEAEIHFLENAKKLLLYGIHLHPAKDAELVDIMIGVSAAGITVFRDGLKINRFIWPKILKIAYKKKTFYLKIRAGEFEHFESTVGFKLASHRLTKRLWRMAIETHTFFRLKEPLPIPTGVFSQFGSKFRFSGRTHYQSRIASSEIDRQAPYFERNSTRRLSASRSMDHGNSSFDRSGAHLSKSMDYMERRTKKSYNEYDDFSPGASNVGQDGKQVSVLAGTGPDASRVAYVKTIKPGMENETTGLDASQDGRYEEPFFEEMRGASPHASGFVSEERSEEGTRKKKKKQSQLSTTKTVTAAIERNVSFDDESLPPYPNVDESFQSPTEMNTSVTSTGEPKKRKPKKKTTTTTTKTSKKTYMDDEGNVVTEVQYKTEKNGVIETRLEQLTSFDETDIDHDLALANAIQNVTEVNPDLAVEKIEVKTKPEIKAKPKTKRKPKQEMLVA